MYNIHKIALECLSEGELTKIHEASIYILEKRGGGSTSRKISKNCKKKWVMKENI